MASEAAGPLKLAPSEVTESMLVPLVNQFGLMQQQMFDQFQQAMAMMVQMFGTMHRDQMEVIRAEVERDQWLGFAMTEATFFYGLVGGFIAFFL